MDPHWRESSEGLTVGRARLANSRTGWLGLPGLSQEDNNNNNNNNNISNY